MVILTHMPNFFGHGFLPAIFFLQMATAFILSFFIHGQCFFGPSFFGSAGAGASSSWVRYQPSPSSQSLTQAPNLAL